MDELFPKLDSRNRRQILGLLPTLDLDAVFTSDKDRCEYDTVDRIAIHVFQRLGDDKTTTTRLVWNGSQTRFEPASLLEGATEDGSRGEESSKRTTATESSEDSIGSSA